jgi:hypothetical protein
LNKHIGDLYRDNKSADIRQTSAVAVVRTDLTGKLSSLQSSCSELKGANGVLTKQAADQQGTINNCQTQALQMLVPERARISPYLWSDEAKDGLDHSATYLILTNKTVTPVHLFISCKVPIKLATGKIVGSQTSTGTSIDQQHNALVAISSPAWTPDSPMRVDLEYTSSRLADCEFYSR